jgi:hypothetical protein
MPGIFDEERRTSRPNWPTPLGTGAISALNGVKERLKWSTLPHVPFLARTEMVSRQTVNVNVDWP